MSRDRRISVLQEDRPQPESQRRLTAANLTEKHRENQQKQSISVLTSLILKFHAILPLFRLCSVNFDEPTSMCFRPFLYNVHAHAGGQNEAGDLYAVRVVISN